MADWRQIQARIRKAKNGSDPISKLSDLYQRTRDAMVAWELGVLEEKAGKTDDAAKWYATAHGRFRRTDWKVKTEEALKRLGVEVPATTSPANDTEQPQQASGEEGHLTESSEEPSEDVQEQPAEDSAPGIEETALKHEGAATPAQQAGKKRRRGRRGGRGRGRHAPGESTGLPSTVFAEPAKAPSETRVERQAFPPPLPAEKRSAPEPFVERRRLPEPSFINRESPAAPSLPSAAMQLPSERIAHGRSDPGLTSRLSQLESSLRRLVSSQLHKLDEAEEAPAGPGVFLLSESDQSTSYYIESCQTLRIGLGNLTRGGGRNSRNKGESGLKARLAEHLGINEAKVAQYMKDHCAVRWIQLDDEAPYLAQFAVAVLRTPLNFED